jgi:hypothetical protein
MMDIPGFTPESLEKVTEMLDFANPADKYFMAKGKKCPPSTQAVGAGFCKNPNPDKAGYIPANKKKCPPNTRAVGAGFCKVDHAEPAAVPCPEKKTPEPPKDTPKAVPGPSTPQATTAMQSDPATKKDPAQKKPPCVKQPAPGISK